MLVILFFIVSICHLAQGSTISVVDPLGLPVPGAKVLIGLSTNDPFEGNFLETDLLGQVYLSEKWNSPQPITVHSEGFIKVTELNIYPQDKEISLIRQDVLPEIEVNGTHDGFDSLEPDGWAHASISLPILTEDQFSFFDINHFVSPFEDTIRVAGFSADIPSNIFIPTQQERFVFKVTFSKPSFRMYFSHLGKKQIKTIQTRFPFKKAARIMAGGGSFVELLRITETLSGSISEIDIKQSGQSETLSVSNRRYEYSSNYTLPQLEDGEAGLFASMGTNDDGFHPYQLTTFYPNQSDIQVKSYNENTFNMNLVSPLSAMEMINDKRDIPFYHFFVTEDDDSTEKHILRSGSISLPDPTHLSIQLPENSEFFEHKGMEFTLTELVPLATTTYASKQRKWIIKSDQWIESVPLPSWPSNKTSERKYRWESRLFALDPQFQSPFETWSDIYYSSIDFQEN